MKIFNIKEIKKCDKFKLGLTDSGKRVFIRGNIDIMNDRGEMQK